jgi:hypothetical protein
MLRKLIHNKIKVSGLLAFGLLTCGCAPTETVYRSLYDGLQKREAMVNTRETPTAKESTSYDAYRRERDEILKKETPSP